MPISLRTFTIVWLVTATAASQPTFGIDIIFEPLHLTTHPQIDPGDFDAEPPGSIDPFSENLEEILGVVEAHFERVFLDPGTIRITWWWDADMNPIGQSMPSHMYENPVGTLTHSVIRFNSAFQLWYVDPTPNNNFEFDMSQVLFDYGPRALDGDTQDARFTGAVPQFFEAGFNGPALAGAGRADLLSVAFQEVGHSLGMNAGFTGVTNGNLTGEADDGDYDVHPGFVQGFQMAMLPRGGATDPLDHLAGNDAVMGSLATTDERTFPSTADYFAIASTQGWTAVDLPRKDFVSGSSWNNALNWLGGRLPDNEDDVFVRHGASINMSNSGQARRLFVLDGSTVNTGTNKLDAAATVTIEGGFGGSPAAISIADGGELETFLIDVNDGGTLAMAGSLFAAAVDADQVNINVGGVLTGNGLVDSAQIVNDGTVTAFGSLSNSALFLGGSASDSVDLDGSQGDGRVFAVLGDLAVIGTLSDAFDGQMTVGAGRAVAMDASWILGGTPNSGATLNLNGGSSTNDAARIGGASMTANAGQINVTGHAALETDINFESSIHVHVETDAVLALNQENTFRGGTYSGGGTLVIDGPTSIEADTTMNVAVIDLDGTGGESTLTMSDSVLTLNAERVDGIGAAHRFDGVMTMNGSSAGLAVNLTNPADSWQMDGSINAFADSSGPQLAIAGSPVAMSGAIFAVGVVEVSASIDVSGLLFTSNALTRIQLSGENNVIRSGASTTGPGELQNIAGQLRLEDGVALGIDLDNFSRLEIGDPDDVGQATVNRSFVQNENGTLAIDIAGVFGNNQDRLVIDEQAALDGILELELIGGFQPAPTAQSIQILFAAGGRSGIFSQVEGVQYGNDLGLAVIYGTDTVDVQPALLGDANLDGTVDGLDFIIWNNWKFTSGTHWATGDFNGDGITDGQDFIFWNRNKFMSVDQYVPEPGMSFGLIFAILLLLRHAGELRFDDRMP